MAESSSKSNQKIAIASSGVTLKSQVDPRFGRCQYFLIVDTKTEEFGVLKNTAAQAFQGAGVSAAQMVADKSVEAVIAGNFGPNAINVLTSSGIKVFKAVFGISVKNALKQYKENKLQQMTINDLSRGMGLGRRGMGRGRGWGRGNK